MVGPEMVGPEMVGPEMVGPEMVGPIRPDRRCCRPPAPTTASQGVPLWTAGLGGPWGPSSPAQTLTATAVAVRTTATPTLMMIIHGPFP